MILTTILVAALATAGAAAVIAFWDDIRSWLKNVVKKLNAAVKATLIGIKAFIKRTKEAYVEIIKGYQKDENGQWHMTTETRTVPESEVPPEIRAKAQQMNKEADITNELEKELKMFL
ncbi:hypothetical protein [Paenibacillus thermotolerans]|uniref:hypothetical protein n=1 Tax=Paenibacillus thermotolerans TaxID=3027807 RepID=UPI0023686EBD|nr:MULTISPECIES: hypothetical protein [unclassified Paenibacillus]